MFRHYHYLSSWIFSVELGILDPTQPGFTAELAALCELACHYPPQPAGKALDPHSKLKKFIQVIFLERTIMVFGMCGLPRSGKSTMVRKIKKIIPQAVIINRDSIRLDVYGRRFYAPGEAMVRAISESMVRVLSGQDIHLIIDECNLNDKMRNHYSHLIGQPIYWIYFLPDVDVCEKRALECDQEDLVEKGVIKSMWSSLTKPEKNLLIALTVSGDVLPEMGSKCDTMEEFESFLKDSTSAL